MSTQDIQMTLAFFAIMTYEDVDGVYGEQTSTAVSVYQSWRQNHLEMDGIAGAQTQTDMLWAVSQVQSKLGVAADGYVGNQTIQAVKNFQAAAQVPTTGYGYANRLTVERLGLSLWDS
jgi:putative peptidoglycan binding domain